MLENEEKSKMGNGSFDNVKKSYCILINFLLPNWSDSLPCHCFLFFLFMKNSKTAADVGAIASGWWEQNTQFSIREELAGTDKW